MKALKIFLTIFLIVFSLYELLIIGVFIMETLKGNEVPRVAYIALGECSLWLLALSIAYKMVKDIS